MRRRKHRRDNHHLASLIEHWAQIKAASRQARQPILWTRDRELLKIARDRYL